MTPQEISSLARKALCLPVGGPSTTAAFNTVRFEFGTLYQAAGVSLGPDVPVTCTIGVYDGFHRGHQALLAAALADARENGRATLAVTFDPNPNEALAGPQASSVLLGVDARVRALLGAGADAVLVLSFTRQMAAMEYRAFFSSVLGQVARVCSLHVGSDFRVGHLGAGDVAALRELGLERGFSVCGHELVNDAGEKIGSTRIRNLLAKGDVAAAAGLLGRCHFVEGVVERGRGEGTSFGFPTANLRVSPRACMPSQGVYACLFRVGGEVWPAAVNVGAPPTFMDEDPAFLEANLIGFSGDLYGREGSVIFVEWLRASRRFDSLEELERVVLSNIDWVRENIGDSGVVIWA